MLSLMSNSQILQTTEVKNKFSDTVFHEVFFCAVHPVREIY